MCLNGGTQLIKSIFSDVMGEVLVFADILLISNGKILPSFNQWFQFPESLFLANTFLTE